jgi:hypothetical protein
LEKLLLFKCSEVIIQAIMNEAKKYLAMIKDMGLLSKGMRVSAILFKETGDLGAIVSQFISFTLAAGGLGLDEHRRYNQ